MTEIGETARYVDGLSQIYFYFCCFYSELFSPWRCQNPLDLHKHDRNNVCCCCMFLADYGKTNLFLILYETDDKNG